MVSAESNCQIKDCAAVATSAVKICVPALGWPIRLHNPLSMILGMKLCWHHAKTFDVQEVLGESEKLGEPGLRPLFVWMAKTMKGLPPDFKRAFVKVIPLDDPEYKLLESKQVEKGEAGG